ncbi:ABC transporter ATP-binding protein [Actinomadura barringtoniae]|uniref:ABC transporter ATP-binding protein n=1 Tax=Actinomadura barringtoniae TaxID=1427535 RepID=A0A939T3W3_9ACTN|nr:ABC transporter ATP-binding protein [Actinomadura barringtoniae]
MLDVEELTVAYPRRPPSVDGVSLTVGRGETLGLVGESGSGKTTLGRAVLGLVPVSGGRIGFDGQEIGHLPAVRRGPGLIHRIQTVFQDPNSSLNPARTVGDSVAESLHGGGRLSRARRRETVGELLERVGLPAVAATRYPHEFSGGQRQRIAIARALAAEPELVVCDEPTSALDLSTQAQMLNLLSDLRREQELSYLFISHDLAVVRHIADRIAVLYQGRVMECGPADQVGLRPAHPYTQALHAAAPIADVAAQRTRRAARTAAMIPADAARRPGGRPDSCPFTSRCPRAADVCGSRRPREVVHDGVTLACHLFDPESGHPDSAVPSSIAHEEMKK